MIKEISTALKEMLTKKPPKCTKTKEELYERQKLIDALKTKNGTVKK